MFQKSIKNSFFMLIILAVFSVVANYSLIGYGSIYYFVINPLFWIFFVIATSFFTSKSSESKIFHGKLMEYSLIAAFVNIGVYILAELFMEIGKNPYSITAKGILINLYVYILPIIAKEYTRFKLINNVYEKDKKFIAIVVTCFYVFVDIGHIDITDSYNVIKIIFSELVPTICVNIVCTYIAMNKSFKPAMFYRVITSLFWIISPYLPKVSWIITTFVDSIIPIILFIYIRYLRVKNDEKKDRKQVEISDPRSAIPVVGCIVITIWFVTGVFPIKPVAVATGSMENTLMVGDVVVIKECKHDDIEIGDIIQYQKDNFTVIHRVISKYYEDGECYFITKGDNNKSEDFLPVSAKQVLGKEVFSIKYLGLPSVWLNKIGIFNVPDTSDIETGM